MLKNIFIILKFKFFIGFITNIGIGNEENYIKYSMQELKNISEDINQMRDAWRNGDINLLNKK